MIRRRTQLILSIALTFGLAGVAHAAPQPIPQAEKKGDAEKKEKAAQAGKTGISWKVAPNHVLIFLDGKKLGDAGTVKFTETKPGKHGVRLTKGGDETEMEVNVKKGEVLSFEFEFTDG